MQKFTADDPETKSADVIGDNLEALKGLFPDAFTEGKVDFKVLKQLLGGALEEGDEKYGLNWHGKRAARQLALTPSTGTLRPCPEESIDWDTTQNLMIEGDNLEVLKLLQKSYTGKVKLIYIDPPYNTGKDFVYADDFRDGIRNYLAATGQAGAEGVRYTSNSEASGRFHATWMSLMLPRLRIARDLLRSDGVLFVSIDDGEVHNLRLLLDELFGSENFVANVVWQKKYSVSNDDPGIGPMHDHIIVYRKSDSFRRNLLPRTEKHNARYTNPDNDPMGPWASGEYVSGKSREERPTLWYPIKHPATGAEVWPEEHAVWRYSLEQHLKLEAEGRLYWGPAGNYERPRLKRYLSDVADGVVPATWWPFADVGHNDEAQKETAKILAPKVFSTPKPIRLLRRILQIGSDADSIVLDFFAGSGATGQAVMEANAEDGGSRRYILVQLPELLDLDNRDQAAAARFVSGLNRPLSLVEVTKERLRRTAESLKSETSSSSGDLGFRVFKLDSSNIEAWEPDRENLTESLTEAIDHLKGHRTEADILSELLLKLGLELTVPIETRQIASKSVYSVGAGTLLVCLAESVDRDDIEVIGLGIVDWHAELAPAGDSTVVFRDSAFADDVAKTNLTAILEQHGLSTVRSL